jgi:hypothetical protein
MAMKQNDEILSQWVATSVLLQSTILKGKSARGRAIQTFFRLSVSQKGYSKDFPVNF